MPRLFKHLVLSLVVLVMFGCSGGGCSSCGGITPIPGGFDANSRVENAGSVRLTQSGLQFLQSNVGVLGNALLGGSDVKFSVPETSGSITVVDYDICPGGANPNGNPPTCTADINISNAQLNIATATDYDLTVTGTVPVLLQSLPINVKYLSIFSDSADLVLSSDGCSAMNAAPIPITVDLTVHADLDTTHGNGYGNTQIAVKSLSSDESKLENYVTFCGGGFTNGVLSDFKSFVIDQIYGQLLSTLQSQIANQLCQKADTSMNPPCPNGSNNVNGVCRYGMTDGDACATTTLGLSGHMNLGALLQTLAPGAQSSIDFLLAAGGPDMRDDGSGFAWGDLNPINNGATLGMFGGAIANPISKCVPLANVALPTGIPIPDELTANTVPNWPAGMSGPDVGIALSERFSNFAMANAYNSGLLCLGISSETEPLLNSTTLGLLAPSLKNLGIQQEQQEIAIAIRPQTPPVLTFGNGTDIKTDPTITVQLKQASFDFYIYSLDRFIRFMTATFDVQVPVNLSVTPMGLQPVIGSLGITNATVTNSSLLAEDPAKLAAALAQLIGAEVGMALGSSLKPINLNNSLAKYGVELDIPDTVKGMGSPGIVKLTKGSDNYLGIFGALALANSMTPKPPPAKTEISLLEKRVDKQGLVLDTITPSNAPVIRLATTSTADSAEYSYRVDNGTWHEFAANNGVLEVNDDILRIQGHHHVDVRSREAGKPKTLGDATSIDFVVDAEPPTVKIGKVDEGGAVSLRVKDFVATNDEVQLRYKLDDGAWSSWAQASVREIIDVGAAKSLSVEVRDPDGNIGTAQEALIRGGPNPNNPSSCSCDVPGGGDRSSSGFFALALAIAGVVARAAKRRSERRNVARALAPIAMIGAAATWSGCSCGSNNQDSSQSTSGAGGSVGTTTSSSSASGGCVAPKCESLQYGLIGEYTSAAVASDGSIWLSGYAEADWDNDYSYGDLVVGKWNGKSTDWVAVDGVPNMPKVDPTKYDTTGFRGGQTAPGDDVGTWTSMVLDASNNPSVAYYDRGKHQLKFAQKAGDSWNISVVDSKTSGDVGRYAKMLALNGGFVIAYLDIEPGGMGGQLVSKVRVASTTKASPSATDWQFEDVATNPKTPCRAQFCTGGAVCVVSTLACTMPLAMSACSPSCASGTACIDSGNGTGSCQTIYDQAKLDSYPPATGDYVSIASDGKGGFGVAFYDRPNGALVTAQKTNGAWSTQVVDGFAVSGDDTGIGASLFIDASGLWHVAYVDGYSEALKYVSIPNDTKPSATEVVDDGNEIAGTPNVDGQHLVGDDPSIFVTPSGEVHISYADSTSGKLHYAVGVPGMLGHTWTVKEIDQPGFAGAFSHILQVNGAEQIANWWRVGGMTTKGDVAIVTP